MQEKEIDFIDSFRTLWAKRKIIIGIVLITVIISAGISLILPKWYKATAVIVAPIADSNSIGLASLSTKSMGFGSIFSDNSDQLRLLAILKSRTMLDMLNNKFDLQTKYKMDFIENTYEAIQSNMRINIGEENQILISYYDKDKEIVDDIVNYIVSSLDSLNISLSNDNAHNKRVFIENRYNSLLDSLKFLGNDISSYMKENKIISLEDQVSSAVSAAAELKAQIIMKEIEYDVQKSELHDNNIYLLNLEKEIKLLNKKYAEFFENNDNKLFPMFGNIPEIQFNLLEKQRIIEYYSKILEFLGPQYEKAKIDEINYMSTIQIIDTAFCPNLRSKPNRKLIVIVSTLSMFFLSIYIILLRERLLNKR
ncbi:MAG: Wzz/FepE/Etk N-terminal domain-containing protein [Candidatus Stygibacter frigidus]|nr:Wzz/FepE/Etk N-terminal domain-containing protein [Candidatus Stygibacter frigidus]